MSVFKTVYEKLTNIKMNFSGVQEMSDGRV